MLHEHPLKSTLVMFLNHRREKYQWHISYPGVYPAGKTFQEVSKCSQRTCIASEDWTEAAWVTKQVFPGCDCCLDRGKMVPDGLNWTAGASPVENWTCFKGKVVKLEDNQVN